MFSERSPSTFAFTRIERIIGRVFSLAAVATSLETLANSISQASFVQPVFLYPSIGLIFIAQLAAVYTFWFGSANQNVYLLHGAAYLIAFLRYPLSVADVAHFPDGFRPWLWWATGTATMAMGMYLSKWWSIAYLGFVPVSWFFLRLLPMGGSASIGEAFLDFFYIILFAAAVLTLIGIMRTAAIAVDRKNDELAESSAKRAEVDATERERQKIDDLVHDQVLTTLILAAKADSPESQSLAVQSAEVAIERLSTMAAENVDNLREVSVGTFIESLAETIRRTFSDAKQNVSKEFDFSIPIPVAIAFADASIQALTNSVQHAGKNAVREVRIKADRHGLKIVISDDGKGFRESKIPKNRLGVRNSIRRRVTAVGGVVRIKAEPRKGSAVVMIWAPNA